MSKHETVIFDELIRETEEAYLFRFERKDRWIAKSLCREFDDRDKTVRLPMWVIEAKELEAYID